jgi:hypothetical protein
LWNLENLLYLFCNGSNATIDGLIKKSESDRVREGAREEGVRERVKARARERVRE